MRFIIGVFGEGHRGMLLTCLYSIRQSNPSAAISVLWQDISSSSIQHIKKTFPRVTFVKTSYNFKGHKLQRISSKTKLWAHASSLYKNEDLCFVDVDVLVRKGTGSYFRKSFDVLFTVKNEKVPLNSGVMLCKNTSGVQNFFTKWNSVTEKIVRDPSQLAFACNSDNGYGGADQMSLCQLIGFKRGIKKYSISLGRKKLTFATHPCSELNETNSRPIRSSTAIIHYKGGWQMILLHGMHFTSRRPRKISWPMYLLYLKTYLQALALLNKRSGSSYHSFGIVFPFYLDQYTFSRNPFLYALYHLRGLCKKCILIFNKHVGGQK